MSIRSRFTTQVFMRLAAFQVLFVVSLLAGGGYATRWFFTHRLTSAPLSPEAIDQAITLFNGALAVAGFASSILLVFVTITAGRRIVAPLEQNLEKERLRLEASLERAQADITAQRASLEIAERVRIDFVANVSHELRTPLTAIKGYTDTLIQDVAEKRPLEPEFLTIVSRNAERLMTLIQDLLDLSALDAGLAVQKIPVSTEEFSKKVLAAIARQIDAKSQRVSLQAIERSVLADPKRLEQVMTNLLDNANKYAPEGGTIEIRWEREGDFAVLRVTNHGPPIAPEHLPRLFERFYRVDKARSRELGGTGLGLAIVKHIVQNHGGAVSVESSAQDGTTFICKFPAS